MKRILYILLIALLAVGCNSEKRMARKAERQARKEQKAQAAAEQLAAQLATPTVTPTTKPTTKPTSKVSTTQPQPKVVEEPVVFEPETLSISAPGIRMTINYQQRTISTAATLTWQRDSIAILAIQPLLGVELLRVEVTRQGITVVDKLNRTYAYLSMAEAKALAGMDISFEALQNEALHILHDSPAPYHFSQSIKSPLKATITADLPSVNINASINAQPVKLTNYKKTDITKMLSGK